MPSNLLHDALIKTLGPLPFPVVYSVEGILDMIEYSLHHLDELEDLQSNNIKWFDQKLYRLRDDLETKWVANK